MSQTCTCIPTSNADSTDSRLRVSHNASSLRTAWKSWRKQDPNNILIIDNKHARSEYANNEPAVQAHRSPRRHPQHPPRTTLERQTRSILLEGKDLAILKTFHAILYPNSETPLDTVPNWSIGGWGGWTHAIGGSMAYKNAFGDRIIRYCILDSDYHTSEEQQTRYQQATERGINLHIWHQKEIAELGQPDVTRRRIVCSGHTDLSRFLSFDDLKPLSGRGPEMPDAVEPELTRTD